jgi:hypothetical protein
MKARVSEKLLVSKQESSLFPALLEKLRRHEDLSADEAAQAMGARS